MNIANIYKSFIHIYPAIGGKVLDLLFPRQCLGCRKEGTWLCSDCLERCPRSFSQREDKIFSVFEYNSPIIKQVVWHLKYKRGLDLAEILAKPTYDCLLEELEDELLLFSPPDLKGAQGLAGAAKIILIPTPLSPARLRSRGYNQAEELAKQIARLNPNQFEVCTDIIKKTKDTPTQVSIRNREARLKNLKNAFVLKNPPDLGLTRGLAGKVVVIIDDVSTTGATISEIRNLLTHNGVNPRRIYGLVVAHG